MSRAVIALLLALAPAARADDGAAREPGSELAHELRETLPGGSRAGVARELPSEVLDFLPKPTKLEIRVRRAASEDPERSR